MSRWIPTQAPELIAHVISKKHYHEALDEVAGVLLTGFRQSHRGLISSTSSIGNERSLASQTTLEAKR